MKPKSYTVTDMKKWKEVDFVCDISDMPEELLKDTYDIVVCTEAIEHIKDWKTAILNLMKLTKVGGFILLTSRSKGFGYHSFPNDFWRYELEDISAIFSEWDIEVLCEDLFVSPKNGFQDHYGFFLKAYKKNDVLPDLKDYLLYNIETDKRHFPNADRSTVDCKMIRTNLDYEVET